MTPSDVSRAFMEHFWMNEDSNAFDAFVSPDVIVHNGYAGEKLARADLVAMRDAFRSFFAELHIEVVETAVEGERVASVVRLTGTAARTGRQITYDGLMFQRVRDGRIVEDITRFDIHEMLVALGEIDPMDRVVELGAVA